MLLTTCLWWLHHLFPLVIDEVFPHLFHRPSISSSSNLAFFLAKRLNLEKIFVLTLCFHHLISEILLPFFLLSFSQFHLLIISICEYILSLWFFLIPGSLILQRSSSNYFIASHDQGLPLSSILTWTSSSWRRLRKMAVVKLSLAMVSEIPSSHSLNISIIIS